MSTKRGKNASIDSVRSHLVRYGRIVESFARELSAGKLERA